MGIEIRLDRQAFPGTTPTTVDYLNAALTEEVKSAIFVFGNPASDDTSTPHATIGLGVGNGASSRGAVGTWRRDDVTTSLGRSRAFNVCLDIPGQVANSIPQADFNSFINTGTRGVRLDFEWLNGVGTGHAAAALFAGSDLAVASGSSLGGTNLTRTGLSRVDLMLFIGPSGGAFGGTGQPGIRFGACAQEPDGTIRQMSVAQVTNAVTFATGQYLSTTQAGITLDNSAAIIGTPLVVTGFSGGDVSHTNPGTTSVAWFAFDFGGRAQATIRAFSNDTARAAVSVDVGFEPIFALLAQTLLQATDAGSTTAADCGTLSLGIVDVADQYVFGNSVMDNAPTTRDVCRSYMSESAIAATAPADGSLVLLADADFGATSVDLNFSTNDNANTRHGFLVAIGPTDLIEFVDDDMEIDDEAVGTGFIATDDETVEIDDEAVAVLDEIPPPDSPEDGREFRLGGGRGGAEALDAGRGGAEALG